MADNDIDLYADDIDNDFNDDRDYKSNVDLYDDVITAPSEDRDDDDRPTSPGAASPQNDRNTKRVAVYVGNLTWWTTDQDLTDAVKSLGVNDILEVKFYENRANGQSKGFCVVALGSESSLHTVMDKLPKKELHGQTPAVTACTRQNLNYFELQSRKGGGGRHENSNDRRSRDFDRDRDARDSRYDSRPMDRPRGRNNPPSPFHQQRMPPGPQQPPPQGPPQYQPRAPWMAGPPPQMQVPPPGVPRPGVPPPPPGLGAPPPVRPGGPMPNNLRLPPPRGPMPGAHFPGPRGIPPPDTRAPPPGDWPGHPPPQHLPPPVNRLPPPVNIPPPGMPPGAPPPHINPAFFHQPPGVPPPAPSQPADIYSRPPPGTQFNDGRFGGAEGPVQGGGVSEAEFEEIMGRNRTVSSSAIARAVADASAGDYASSIETLVTAISLIKQSKVANDERCKILIGSLQDTLHGIESKSYGSRKERARSRERERSRERPSRREKSRRERSRSREYRDRSRERDRYHEDRYREKDRDHERERRGRH